MNVIKTVPAEYRNLPVADKANLESGFLRLSLPLSAYCEINTIQAVQAFTTAAADPNAPAGKGLPHSAAAAAASPSSTLAGPSASPGLNLLELNVISESEVTPMLRMMNLALTSGDVEKLIAEAGRSVNTLIGDKLPGIGHHLPPLSPSTSAAALVVSTEGGQQNTTTPPGSPLLFDYDAVIHIFNLVAPLQHAFALDYMGFFNLLDPEEKEYISMADLRHALCNLGDSLTDREFNHLMYVNGFLHRVTISIYEFMRYVMAIEPNDCVTAVGDLTGTLVGMASPTAAETATAAAWDVDGVDEEEEEEGQRRMLLAEVSDVNHVNELGGGGIVGAQQPSANDAMVAGLVAAE